MSRKRRDLSAEEAELWRQIARSVAPLREAPASNLNRNANSSGPRAPARAAASRPSRVKPPPTDRAGEKRVRRGNVEIGGALDLHGLTQDRARAALVAFLKRMKTQGARVALIVTGKGGRSRDGETAPGVLKRRLPDWLAESALRRLVSGYAEAHARHGGAGAFYVFLRRKD